MAPWGVVRRSEIVNLNILVSYTLCNVPPVCKRPGYFIETKTFLAVQVRNFPFFSEIGTSINAPDCLRLD